jgi:hypothetical protein
VVRRDVSGLLVEPKNSTALAAALERLVVDPALRARLGAAGQARAHDYTWERVTKRLAEYYTEILERRGATGWRSTAARQSPHATPTQDPASDPRSELTVRTASAPSPIASEKNEAPAP